MFNIMLVDATYLAKMLHKASPVEVVERMAYALERVAQTYFGLATVLLWDHPDSKKPRRALFPDYKAVRPVDEACDASVRVCLERFRHEYECWYDPDYEADDLLASLVHHYLDLSHLIYARDKDFHGLLALPGFRRQLMQAVGPANRWEYADVEYVMKKYSVKASQWYEYQAIVGDSVDGIPGIDSLGKDTAVKILHLYPTVKEAVANVEQIPISKSRQAKLKAAYDDGTFELMLQLVSPRIIPRVPAQLDAMVRATKKFTSPLAHNGTLQQLLDIKPTLPPPF